MRKKHSLLVVVGSLVALVGGVASGAVIGCGGSSSNEASGGDGGSAGGDAGNDGASGGSCVACANASDCSGGAACVQLGVDSYCLAPCGGGSSCAADSACTNATTFDGKPVMACVPRGECGSGGVDRDAGGPTPDAGIPYDGGGGPVTGTVGPDGGSLSRLLFAIVGDTRPANYDDVAGYPTAIITRIFQDIEAANPKIPFVLATGDYQFASSGSTSTAAQQLDLYLGARKSYSGIQYPVMGNHECTGATASNCGAGNTNGTTANYSAFMSMLLAPLQKTKPYYAITIDATDKSWTSKFVFVAANAWDSAQSSWLSTTLAQKTTYTFVIRHEPEGASPAAPGQAPSQAIIDANPYTLEIVGHSHTYGHYPTPNPREVLVGNGGAPLTSTKDYGFAVLSQRADGVIVGDMIDYMSGKADPLFHFAVKPDGTLTQ